MNRHALVCLLFVASAGIGLWAADDIIGQLSFVQGKVEIIRNGQVLSGKNAATGVKIQNFDQIKVPKSSTAEIKLEAQTGINGTIKISQSSLIKLDITSMKKNQKAGIDLLAGSVDLKVQKLASGNSLDVRTSTAVMGVRGTTYSVTVSPADDVLVACDEGRVSVQPSSGDELFSEPGVVVEGSYDDAWSNEEVPVAGLNEFRNRWFQGKVEAFRADPSRAVRQMASRYVKYRKDFREAWDLLQKERATLKRWQDQEAQGSSGTTMENMKDKKAMLKPMFKGRAALFFLEHAYLRLQQLEEYLPDVNIQGKLDDGTTIADFLKTFRKDSLELSNQINEMNYYVKLFAKRNGGTFPLDGMTGDAFN